MTNDQTSFFKRSHFSIIVLLSCFAVQSAVNLAYGNNSPEERASAFNIAIFALLAAVLAYGWYALWRQFQRSFAAVAIVISSLLIAASVHSIHAFAGKANMVSAYYSARWLVFELILIIQLIIYLLESTEQQHEELSIRQVLFAVGALELLIAPLTGIACLAADASCMVLCWLQVLTLPAAVMIQGRGPVAIFQQIFPSLVIAVLLCTSLRRGMVRNVVGKFFKALGKASARGGYSSGYRMGLSQSKSCGRCGKTVANFYGAGQRCPHCGCYWSFERNIGFRK